MSDLSSLETDYKRAEHLQNMLISCATGGWADQSEYQQLRRHFLDRPEYKDLLPDFVRTKRDLSQFWSFIKMELSTYRDRREFLWANFEKLLGYLEGTNRNPVSKSLSSERLLKSGANAIHEEIQKGLERVSVDPRGAITLARTILESTCKFIAEERSIDYADAIDLSPLYKKIADELNLSPGQHDEQIFKQILGGCSGIVSGLGSLRNKLSDSHGRGPKKAKPAPRHAELAVSLAGSMAVFLLETHEANKREP